ncbi:ATPase family AAA domain-containing protein 3-B [Lachnellula suecica]|uniref:ATPase family AAA domain-containing protein 3-B n=1 Tax=Lachnellula suecica TaxID=602035 RepID=A0A8T9CBM7_9HELO|nr:ATPase family AAA domain-containing protein 3-B [Lachnellula suecica]
MSERGSSVQYHRSVGSSSPSLSKMSVDSNYTPEFISGMRPETKQLYRSDDRSPWDEWNPAADKIHKDAEAGSYAQECAIIVRREPHPSNNNQPALHSITVQSPLIKKVLDGIFEGFEGLNTQLKVLTFKAPFHPFYYRWHRFEKLRNDEQDLDTKSHLDLLYEIISEEILPHIEAMEDLIKNNVMSFDYLWAIFSPGMEVYTNIDGHDRILSLKNCSYGANMSGEFFSLECRYIDCDGSRFGYVETSIEINSFNGVKRLTDLDAIPSHLHPDIESLIRRLRARGERFELLNGFHHMSYSGFYTSRSSRQVRKRHVENGRIIIDPKSFSIYGMPGPNLEAMESTSQTELTEADIFNGIDNVIYKATRQTFSKYQKVLRSFNRTGNSEMSVSVSILTLKQRLLCAPIVSGYCLTSKSWAEFDIENVCPIRWSENAFAELVLPGGYKDIIRAFVHEQLSREDGFDDIISGKGLGFIMLLSGDPGVGKTLTAESVAEEMHQPLYSMSAGELGETAAEVEESLDLVLDLTNKWNAILLLDECDMFLEARTTADIRRNRLISVTYLVFLKKLEYYRGVMFLTSNRISDFDAAFESRIHLTIHYPALDMASRLHIWKTFVGMGKSDSQLSEKDLETLAKNEINGRQIKNIVKTARLLSKQQSTPLAMHHVDMVLRVKKGVTNLT